MLAKMEDKRRRGWKKMRWLNIIINSMDMNLSKLREIVKDRGDWCAIVHGVAKSHIQLSDLTFTFPFMNWRRKWQPIPVFLPGESQGRGSLVGRSPRGR